MKRFILILTIVLTLSGIAQAQDCVNIPQSQSWKGETTQGMGDMYGNNNSITVSRTAENTYRVSDVSGGFLVEMGTSAASVVLTFGCNNQLSSTSVETTYGTLQIASGSFDASNNKLTINWSIPFQGLSETTLIQPN
ncbi:MAG: hypothetical protein GY816_13130 [Cytophagales bacterium]|nr:hypothetical protein [Cytophagales bacterium]